MSEEREVRGMEATATIALIKLVAKRQVKWQAIEDKSTPDNWFVSCFSFGDNRGVVYDENTQAEAELIAALCNLLNVDTWDKLEPILRELTPESFPAQAAAGWGGGRRG